MYLAAANAASSVSSCQAAANSPDEASLPGPQPHTAQLGAGGGGEKWIYQRGNANELLRQESRGLLAPPVQPAALPDWYQPGACALQRSVTCSITQSP